MFKAKIVNIEKVRHQATEKDFLDLTVEVIEIAEKGKTFMVPHPDDAKKTIKVSERVVSTQKHALDPSMSKKEVLEVVEKIRAGWALEQEQKAANAMENAINENINELREELVGSEVETDN